MNVERHHITEGLSVSLEYDGTLTELGRNMVRKAVLTALDGMIVPVTTSAEEVILHTEVQEPDHFGSLPLSAVTFHAPAGSVNTEALQALQIPEFSRFAVEVHLAEAEESAQAEDATEPGPEARKVSAQELVAQREREIVAEMQERERAAKKAEIRAAAMQEAENQLFAVLVTVPQGTAEIPETRCRRKDRSGLDAPPDNRFVRLARECALIGSVIGLTGWSLVILPDFPEEGEEAVSEGAACCQPNGPLQELKMWFAEEFFRMPGEDQVETILHELLHAYDWETRKVIEAAHQSDVFQPHTKDFFYLEYDRAAERSVERQAKAWAKHLPFDVPEFR